MKRISGVGRVTEDKLTALGIKTCGDLQKLPRLELANHFERLRQWAKAHPWAARAVEEIEEPPLPVWSGMDLDFQLANQVRRFRVAAARHEPDDRRRADRHAGGPLWRFCWALAELWGTSGRYVGRGPKTAFQGFAGNVFAALSEEPPQRVLNEVAKRWQERAGALTAKAQKTPLPSFAG